jgi:hypothetical protein
MHTNEVITIKENPEWIRSPTFRQQAFVNSTHSLFPTLPTSLRGFVATIAVSFPNNPQDHVTDITLFFVQFMKSVGNVEQGELPQLPKQSETSEKSELPIAARLKGRRNSFRSRSCSLYITIVIEIH